MGTAHPGACMSQASRRNWRPARVQTFHADIINRVAHVSVGRFLASMETYVFISFA